MFNLPRTMMVNEKVIGCNLLPLQDLYTCRTLNRTVKIISDPDHPGHKHFEALLFNRRLWSIKAKTSCHKNFFPFSHQQYPGPSMVSYPASWWLTINPTLLFHIFICCINTYPRLLYCTFLILKNIKHWNKFLTAESLSHISILVSVLLQLI